MKRRADWVEEVRREERMVRKKESVEKKVEAKVRELRRE